jgi:oxygen-independent coproporphyrinogen-3 oxidase
MSMLKVDLDLVRKYNIAGPRYTSYPPATKFSEAVGLPQLVEHIRSNNETERDLSLYFHIPFCETLCWFCGCTTVITTNHAQGQTYIDYIEKEMAQMASMVNPQRKVVQLHWGGGSPTFLSPDEIRALGKAIRRHFTLAENIEAGVEIDPRRLSPDHVVALREAGFNRASFGVQDFEPKVQEAVHRIQPRKMTENALTWARENGFSSINFDLIYGLPHQTVESFNRTLDIVLSLKPDRLAVFSYAHVPWVKPAQKILEQKNLPSPEIKLQLLKTVIERLTDKNQYVYIGMDHFAHPEDELAIAQSKKQLQRNFQGYSTRAGSDIYSFGMSAISQIPDAYWQNEKELPKYYAEVAANKTPVARGYLMSHEDKIRREVIMRVMCDMSLDYASMSEQLGLDFGVHFEQELESLAPLEADGLVLRTPRGLDVTETGRLFIRNVAMCFDNTLAPSGERKHSRTI